MARWSSGQDGGLSRRKREFDSPTGHHFPGTGLSPAGEGKEVSVLEPRFQTVRSTVWATHPSHEALGFAGRSSKAALCTPTGHHHNPL